MRYAMKMTREGYVPKGSLKVKDKQSDAVAYIYARRNRAGQVVPCAALFFGKQSKPIWQYQFASEQKRAQRIEEGFASRRAAAARKAGEQAKRKAFVNPYKVGDLFKRSWGYEQTNVNYYEVIEAKGRYVWVREIQQEYVETAFMSGKTGPMVGQFKENSAAKKCLAQEGAVKINDYAWAYFVTPKIVGGVKVYDSAFTSSYA